MKIRKEFRVESAHIVRNCTSHRCSHSIHGHSAVIEVFLESNTLDNAQMVYDFGLMKNSIKRFIDGMDHCYLLCGYDKAEFKNNIFTECDRWIELPFNPSAEMLSLFVMWGVNRILATTIPANGEGTVKCTGVRYHETTTGWAECNEQDYQNIFVLNDYHHIENYCFSDGVIADMGKDVLNMLKNVQFDYNPAIEQQIDLHYTKEERNTKQGPDSDGKSESPNPDTASVQNLEALNASLSDALAHLSTSIKTFLQPISDELERITSQK